MRGIIRFMRFAILIAGFSIVAIWLVEIGLHAQDSSIIDSPDGAAVPADTANQKGEPVEANSTQPTAKTDVPASQGKAASPEGLQEENPVAEQQPAPKGKFVISAANAKQPAVQETAKRLQREGFKLIDRGTEAADEPGSTNLLPAVILRAHDSTDTDALHSMALRLLMPGNIRWIEIQLDALARPSYFQAKVIPTKDTPYTQVADTVKLLIESGIPNIAIDQIQPDSLLATKYRHAASLLIVNSDWTKSPTAKQILTDLEEGLHRANLPAKLRSESLENATQLLFAEDSAALYESRHIDELLSWMKQHKLIQHVVDFDVAPLTEVEAETVGNAVKMEFPVSSEFNDSKVLLPLPFSAPADEIFVRSNLAWGWTILNSAPNRKFTILTALVHWKKYQGQPQPLRVDDLFRCEHQLTIPAGKVAIVRAMAHLVTDEDPLQLKMFPNKLQQAGQEPLLIIRSPEARLASEVPAAFHIPDEVVPYTARYSIQSDLNSATDHSLSLKSTTSPTEKETKQQKGTRLPSNTAEKSTIPNVGPNTNQQRSTAKESTPAVSTRIFHLRHIRAEEFHTLLVQLNDPLPGTCSTNARTNTFIIRGSEEFLLEVEALARMLDVEDSMPQAAGSTNTSDGSGTTQQPSNQTTQTPGNRTLQGGSDEESVAQIRNQSITRERQTIEIALQLREALEKQPQDQEHITKERLRLNNAVIESFAARQDLQRAEVSLLEQRLHALKRSIANRERIREQIIKHRIDDLLNPARQWNGNLVEGSPSPQSPSLKPTAAQPNPTIPPASARIPNVTNQIASPNQPGRTPQPNPNYELPAVNQPSEVDRSQISIQGATKFREVLNQTVARLEAANAILMNELEEQRQSIPDVTEELLAKKHPLEYHAFKQELNEAQRQLDALRQEHEALLKVLALDLTQAQAKSELANSEHERLTQLASKNVVSRQMVERSKVELQIQQVAVERAKVILDLYRKIEFPKEKPDPREMRR